MAKLNIERGTTYTIAFAYQKNGAAHTLVGATVRFTMKPTEYSEDTADADASLVKNVTDGAADGTATITINPSDTSALAPGKYFYDIKVDEASDGATVYKAVEGTINLGASPTNRLA